MSALKVGLNWCRDSHGYRFVDYGTYGKSIIGVGGAPIETQPLRNDMVFLAFANIRTDLQLMEFIHHYGLLNRRTYDDHYGEVAVDPATLTSIESRPIIQGERVAGHLKTAAMFRELIALKVRGGRASKKLSDWIDGQLLDERLGDVSLEFSRGRGFQMGFRADTLLNGMLLQLAQKVSGQFDLKVCKLCNTVFEVGPGSGRRSDADFCSREHTVKFHSGQRSKERDV